MKEERLINKIRHNNNHTYNGKTPQVVFSSNAEIAKPATVEDEIRSAMISGKNLDLDNNWAVSSAPFKDSEFIEFLLNFFVFETGSLTYATRLDILNKVLRDDFRINNMKEILESIVPFNLSLVENFIIMRSASKSIYKPIIEKSIIYNSVYWGMLPDGASTWAVRDFQSNAAKFGFTLEQAESITHAQINKFFIKKVHFFGYISAARILNAKYFGNTDIVDDLDSRRIKTKKVLLKFIQTNKENNGIESSLKKHPGM